MKRIKRRNPGSYYRLNHNEKGRLLSLNERLAAIEHQFLPIILQLKAEMSDRVSSPFDWLDDYEIELSVDLYLSEEDPEWSENDDNIIVTLNEFVKLTKTVPIFGFGATHVNHGKFPPFEGEHHCWLYHCLYDHMCLAWRDLLRIGSIGVDLRVTYQILPGGKSHA